MKTNMTNIGLILKKIRQEKNISAYELSLRIGKVNDYMYKVEKGEVNISLLRFIEICQALDVEPSYVLELLNKN